MDGLSQTGSCTWALTSTSLNEEVLLKTSPIMAVARVKNLMVGMKLNFLKQVNLKGVVQEASLFSDFSIKL